MMEEILVSIWCPTYNHELYIKDAIEGFLSQKVNFRYEIIIHDDASTDMTGKIVQEYEEKYPDLIHGIYQTENQYSKNQPNIKWMRDIIIKNCKGKYIAACDGDDYWIDIQKLQLQVNYLEKHPECIMTVHDTIDLDCVNNTVKSRSLYAKDCIVPSQDIITQKALIPTASTMYRREALDSDEFFWKSGVGDYPILLNCLTQGNIYYFSRIMAVYRRGQKGSWRTSMQNIKYYLNHHMRIIDFLEKYNKYTEEKYEKFVINKIQCQIDNVLAYCEGKSIEDLYGICESNNEELDKRFKDFCSRIARLRKQIFDVKYLDRDLKEFVVKYPRIVIMGAGRYAGVIAKQLDYHGIPFEGFIISNNQISERYYLKKNVWKLNEVPFELDQIGIIIGINPIRWIEIMDALENAGASKYVCPYLFK